MDVVITETPGVGPRVGVVMIEVPPQPEGLKPFLVKGTVIEDKIAGAFITVPTRVRDGIEHLDIRVIHGRLQAGRIHLESAGVSASPSGEDLAAITRRLDALDDASTPAFLRTVVAAARASGFDVGHSPSAITFRRGSGSPIVARTSSSGSIADPLAREQLLSALATQGLRVERSPTGFLRPRA